MHTNQHSITPASRDLIKIFTSSSIFWHENVVMQNLMLPKMDIDDDYSLDTYQYTKIKNQGLHHGVGGFSGSKLYP